MKRRHFLQFSGSALAAMGLSQAQFLQQANRQGRALAQPTSRKLALLIGINDYPNPADNLYGCITDVEMQHQLLVNRFGFNAADILTLTTDATEDWRRPNRANILQAFETHLIQQAQPGDVVVFHYSGHGSRVKDPDPISVQACGGENTAGLNGSLVPIDRTPANQTGPNIVVPDIMGRSLFLLMARIQTENLTVVLDSCFSGAGSRGTARVRAANSRLTRNGEVFFASEEEFDNQQRWMRDLNLSSQEFHRRRAAGIAKGVALGSASCDQLALEIPYDSNRTAGTFTYLLTSYLWQSPSSEPAARVQANLIRSTKAATVTQRREAQVPIFEYKPNSQHHQKPLYFLDSSMMAPFADAVITNVTGEQIEFWLGGVSPQNLKTAGAGAVFTVLQSTGETVGEIVQESRSGLYGYGKLAEGQSAKVEQGMLLREKILTIPNPMLRIGLDASLADEAAQAQAALEGAITTTASATGRAVSRVTVLPVDTQSDVEYILARTTEKIRRQFEQADVMSVPPLGAIALFAPDFSTFVPDTAGRVNEPATAAVNRLRPRFKSLLVGKVLQELAGASSDLQVSGEVFAPSGRGPTIPLIDRGVHGQSSAEASLAISTDPFQAEEVIQLRVRNREREAIYLSVLAITSSGEIVMLHPANWEAAVEAARIGPGEELLAPQKEDEVELVVRGSGFIELLTLVSRAPLNRLLDGLKIIAGDRSRGAVRFSEGDPISVIDDLLSDIDRLSRGEIASRPTEGRSAINSNSVAVFSTLVEVVEGEREMGLNQADLKFGGLISPLAAIALHSSPKSVVSFEKQGSSSIRDSKGVKNILHSRMI